MLAGVAIVGTGSFAHNVCRVLERGGVRIACFVDERRTGSFMDRPVVAAENLEVQGDQAPAKYLVAISVQEFREAAVQRLLARGVAEGRIISLADDHMIPVLDLIFGPGDQATTDFFLSEECCSLLDLERFCWEDQWSAARQSLDPSRPSVYFAFFGRGGGFRRHIKGLIPRLRDRYNIVLLADETIEPKEMDGPRVYVSPETACAPERLGLPLPDLTITAHFIPCSSPRAPKVTFLHTSFDFILDTDWIVDRLDTADPHYIVTSTQATHQWMKDLVHQRKLETPLCLIPGGYARLDENIRYMEDHSSPLDSFVYAPTLSLSGLANHDLTYSIPHALDLVRTVTEKFPDHQVIFRPHPHDLKQIRNGRDDELAAPMLRLMDFCDAHPRCHLDEEKTFYMHSYGRSAAMIADTSSTAYTYALSTCRPVAFFSPRDDEVRRLYGPKATFIRDRDRVGQVVTSVADMAPVLAGMVEEADLWKAKVREYRDEVCFHPGRSEEYFLENLEFILTGKRHPDWYYLNWTREK